MALSKLNHLQQLQALIRLANVDVAALSERDAQRLDRDLQRVIHRDDPPHERFPPARVDRVAIGVYQQRVAAVLRGLTKGGVLTMSGSLVLSFMGIRKDDAVAIWVKGSDLDMLLYQTMQLLAIVGPQKVQACPGCDRLFVKVTKKQNCSARCQMRIYMRNRRAAERAAEAEFQRKGLRHGETTRSR